MTMDIGTLAVLMPLLFLLFGLSFTVVIDPYIISDGNTGEPCW